MRQDELKDNFLNNGNETRDSLYIENQMEKFKEEHEGDMILNDILLLEEMGYDKKMINLTRKYWKSLRLYDRNKWI